MRTQIAMRLADDAAAGLLWNQDDASPLNDLCKTDDNGGPPDGTAWLNWYADGRNVGEFELGIAHGAGIAADLVRVYITDYPAGKWHPDTGDREWMGHQSTNEAAWMTPEDALWFESLPDQEED